MIIRRGRRCRAAPTSRRAAGAVLATLALVLGVADMAGAGQGAMDDRRDAGTRLDLKALTHADNGSSVIYTAETYAPFTDQSAVFTWGIDRTGDEDFDLIVFTEWRGGELVGGVKDTAGREVAAAAVSRPAPNVIRVSFPVGALGDAAAYRYAVNAEGTSGQRDLAPDSGLTQHRLGDASAPSQPRAASSTPPSEPTPVAAAPAPTASAAAPQVGLPTTGSDDGRALLPVAGAAFMVGGALIAAAPRRGRRR